MKQAILRDRDAYLFLQQAKTWRSAWQIAARPAYGTSPMVLYVYRALMRDYAKFAISSAKSRIPSSL